MIVVLKGSERTAHKDLFDQYLRFHYEIFLRGHGWTARNAGGRKTDRYDDDDAVYFFDLDEAGRIQAGVRITPTVTSSLIADYFPHLVENGQPPRAPAIYERTRTVMRHGRDGDNHNAHPGLIRAIPEWCLAHGITHLQTVINFASLRSYLAVTPLTTPLGLPHPYRCSRDAPGGGQCIAVRWPICAQLLADVQKYAALDKVRAETRRLH